MGRLGGHDDLKVAIGFLPEPLTLASFAAMRLSEVAPHVWDVRAGVDPAASLTAASAVLLAEHLGDGLGFLLSFIAKPAAVGEHAVLDVGGMPYRIVLDDSARLTTQALPGTATFTGPLESAVRLIYGRLTPKHTPADVAVTGNVSLDQLRPVFPGF